METSDLSRVTYQGDPILWLLVGKLHLRHQTVFLIGFGFSILVHLVIGNVIGVTLFPLNSIQQGLVYSWHEVIHEFVLAPLIWCFYAWMPSGINRMFNTLWENNVFTKDAEYEEFLKEFRSTFRHVIVAPVFALLAVIGVLMVEVPYWKTWAIALSSPNSSTYFALYGFYMGLGWYFVVMIACREILVVLELSKLFKGREVKVRLWHSDRRGGIGILSTYRLNIAVILATMALTLISVSFPGPRKAPSPARSLVVWIPLYLVAGPVIFFIPLFTAHEAMKTAKGKLIADISRNLDRHLVTATNYQSTARIIGMKVHEQEWKAFQRFLELHRMALEYPEWPFDLSVLSRFLVITLLPVLLDLAERLFF